MSLCWAVLAHVLQVSSKSEYVLLASPWWLPETLPHSAQKDSIWGYRTPLKGLIYRFSPRHLAKRQHLKRCQIFVRGWLSGFRGRSAIISVLSPQPTGTACTKSEYAWIRWTLPPSLDSLRPASSTHLNPQWDRKHRAVETHCPPKETAHRFTCSQTPALLAASLESQRGLSQVHSIMYKL